MGFYRGPNIVTNGLVLALDAGNPKSYVSGSTIWNDASGNNFTGSLINGTSYSTLNGGTMVFSGTGSNNYIDIKNSATVANINAVTLSTWIRPSQVTLSNLRIYDENTSTIGYTRFGLEQDGASVVMKWRDSTKDPSGLTPNTLTTDSILAINIWKYVVCVYDSNNDTQCIYINGILNIESNISISPFGNSVTAGINIGRSPGDLLYFTGSIANVQLYNRALSSQEVEQNYDALKGRFGLD